MRVYAVIKNKCNAWIDSVKLFNPTSEEIWKLEFHRQDRFVDGEDTVIKLTDVVTDFDLPKSLSKGSSDSELFKWINNSDLEEVVLENRGDCSNDLMVCNLLFIDREKVLDFDESYLSYVSQRIISEV